MALKKISGVVVEPLILDTYLAFIEASVDSPLFRTFYAKVNGKRVEVTGNGNLSCAFYTSSVLKLFNLVQEVQVTNNRVLRDMEASGWVEVPRPKLGCVVIWKEKDADPARMKRDGKTYQAKVKHCGFFIGKGMCVSTGGDEEKSPRKHPLTYRPVDRYFWHPALDKQFKNPTKKSPKHQPGIYWQPNK